MQENILGLTQKLISISSVAGDELAMREVLTTAKKELAGFLITEFESAGITSLLVSNKSTLSKKYKIILNAHLDVVPGTARQYFPVVKDGRLYGRGAYDMKAAAAVMILLFKEIASKVKYPLGLQITTDEETGGANGTGHQVGKGIRADFVITGEGTNFRIVNETKSKMILKLIADGKASHGAYPWLGDNAIVNMQRAIHQIYMKYPLPEEEWNGSTLNVTSIRTENQALNKTPNHCEAIIDVRAVPSEKKGLLEVINNLVGGKISVEILNDSLPHMTDQDSVFIGKLKRSAEGVLGNKLEFIRAHGESDARFYTAVGCDGVEFGPVGGNHHADDEWVDIKSLEDYYDILKHLLVEPIYGI